MSRRFPWLAVCVWSAVAWLEGCASGSGPPLVPDTGARVLQDDSGRRITAGRMH